MPDVKPISDLQGNVGAIADICRKTKEPVHLPKNGSASLVAMDTEAYDEQARALAAIQQSIARGYDDLINVRIRPWKQAKAEADQIRASRQPSPM